MKSQEIYEPKGFKFWDKDFGQMILIEDDESDFNGWLCSQHNDGEWVTIRRATDEDIKRLNDLKRINNRG